MRGGHVLLAYGELSGDATAFADVGMFRESIGGTHDIRPQSQFRPADAAISARRCSLQPISQRETLIFGARDMLLRGRCLDIDA